MLAITTVTSPVLVAGAFRVTFGDFERVMEASVSFDNPRIGGWVFATAVSLATNVVTVAVSKIDIAGAAGVAWVDAVTADVSGRKLTVIADCI